MTLGVLLFAHGARDPRWAQPFEAIAQQLRSHPGAPEVRLAFLEFMTPSLIEAGVQLVLAGCTQVTVAPLFLGAGGHVRKDLPELMTQLQCTHPAVTWSLMPAIGEIHSVTQAMAQAVWHTVMGDSGPSLLTGHPA